MSRGRSGRWWLRLTRFAGPHAPGIAPVLLLTVAGIGVDVLRPWPLKIVIDHVISGTPLPGQLAWLERLPGASGASGLLGWMAAGMLLVFVAHRIAAVAQTHYRTGVGGRMTFELGATLFDHLQSLSTRFYRRQAVGDLMRRVTSDSRCVTDVVMGVMLPLAESLITLGLMFGILWRLDRELAILTLVAALPIGVMIRVFARPMTERATRQMELEGEVMSLAEQTLSALPIVQGFAREDYEDARFRRLSRRTVHAYVRSALSQLEFKVGTRAATAGGTALILAFGGFHVLDGTLTIGGLLVFLSYLASLYAPLETMAYLSSGYAAAAARARRTLDVLDAEIDVVATPGAPPLPGLVPGSGAGVSFEDVTFGYDGGRPVLDGVTLSVAAGETVALVGPSGAGKTTLVSLVPRLFDPWRGRVTVDGVDVASVSLSSLRSRVAMLLQEAYLLPISVADNIAYGAPSAHRREIEAAARAANADAFIRRLDGGYEAVIGERGATLSGGEQQRVAIARALLMDAPILILDEPTASLDAGTEHLMMEAIRRLMQGRTTLIVAHRLSTIQQADRIVVLEDGRVTEEGDQAALLASGGAYARFRALQETIPHPALETRPTAARSR